MTYHCGIGGNIPGVAPRDPRVTCDGHDCDASQSGVRGNDGFPMAWLRKGKAPRGWKLIRIEQPSGIVRFDFCPKCKTSVTVTVTR